MGHGVPGIEGQVQDHLMQLGGIANDAPRFAVQLQLQADFLQERLFHDLGHVT